MKNNFCKLNNRIQLLRPEERQDEMGGIELDYVPCFSLWAKLQPVDYRNGESWQTGALDFVNEYKVFVRVDHPITADMQIQWKGQIFEMKTPPSYAENKKYQFFIIRSINQDRG